MNEGAAELVTAAVKDVPLDDAAKELLAAGGALLEFNDNEGKAGEPELDAAAEETLSKAEWMADAVAEALRLGARVDEAKPEDNDEVSLMGGEPDVEDAMTDEELEMVLDDAAAAEVLLEDSTS